jgi:hypothetical protein
MIHTGGVAMNNRCGLSYEAMVERHGAGVYRAPNVATGSETISVLRYIG